MRLPLLICALLGAVSLSLESYLEPWFQSWAGNRARSADLLTVTLGDSRRLFAKHFYAKADAYFHSGYYPTIYDAGSAPGPMHIAAASGAAEEKGEEEADFLGKPRDWIDAFSRHFFPSTHRHLGEKAHDHGDDGHDKHQENSSGEEREILPWLRLSANLDPDRPETYIVASFWLRSRLGKVNEAEQFLREGLQANPGHYEILLELGRIYKENHNDVNRARNVWELALRNWREKESAKADPNIFAYAQLLGNLATLEEQQQNYSKAVEHLTFLKQVSPHKESVQKWLDDLKAKAPSSAAH
jgi:tetratricopeptide (TPR) repeat protein